MAKIEEHQGGVIKWIEENLTYAISVNPTMAFAMIEFFLGDRKVGEIELFDIDLIMIPPKKDLPFRAKECC